MRSSTPFIDAPAPSATAALPARRRTWRRVVQSRAAHLFGAVVALLALLVAGSALRVDAVAGLADVAVAAAVVLAGDGRFRRQPSGHVS